MKQPTHYILLVVSLLSALLGALANRPAFAATPDSKSIVMVLSGYGQPDQQTPGYEFDEFAKAYLVFQAHGIRVDIASPQGGKIEADKYDPAKSYNQQVLNDAAIMAKLHHSLSTAQLKASNYKGIFIVGGKGAMFDLPKDPALQQLIADIYQQQGAVAAVCHGPAALVNVKLADGSYLVANKVVNGFSNDEEHLFGKKWLADFDFMLQDKLIERGGRFEHSPLMLSHVAVDNRLFTGQNPASTVAVARELVKALGIKPLPMAPYKDDATLALVASWLNGNITAAQLLAADAAQYQLELLGMYGYYYRHSAGTAQALQQALVLMQAGQSAINNPALDMAVAQTQLKLGDKTAARATLQQILATKPDFAAATALLATL
ncbi:MAG: type 1 glutamine amidotransferase domain-containing protein [Gammaproteobacteria bacterium]|nr:type 1 glutamine amidotransferase domain-containing protein [Gammaproteobacteria bacterium]MBU1554655.1 type 1 glutamine amidotransferase domain-containing protein [Gammaproteobacteria bacterium]MBU2069118.1 type 1 glutamine amidotransferase domain-containing protein [Gammaproteobacteria bacterium]MBU2182627.1 type 1 glutamine amidotransferase domain-containing protein [Gammaproteobacteria bacterium]MBU2206554.1 type 1 glutamine amidotransferase domain-containing protein [Gammaproteobacteria